ncbi:hypothetical protein BBJ28_00003286 [Nothophytophthora sp. Chile5]|nr:hypothetical protein BBJ28_00003286 [Nothophytophthora sp. Chile5]
MTAVTVLACAASQPVCNGEKANAYVHFDSKTKVGEKQTPTNEESTGRSKTEQVVLEFLYKVAELIVQSRVAFQAEPDLRRGNRRARFNLDIEEVPFVREAMAAWKEDVRLPLAIDVFWAGDGQRVLLERWHVVFAPDDDNTSAFLSSTYDVIQQLKEVCKRISVLLRALFSFMRQLPAHRLFAQSYPSALSYKLHTASASDSARVFAATGAATSGYAFIPIVTPFGRLKVSAVYRRDCDQFSERQEQTTPSRLFQDNYIIQDYVPSSPELVPTSSPGPQGLHDGLMLADSPMTVTDLRTDSFMPVSDAEQFEPLAGVEQQRRRSTPLSIPTAGTSQQQQFSSTGPTGDDPETMSRRPPTISKPMAIPRVSSKGAVGAMAAAAAATAGYGDDQDDSKMIQHAHSYGGEHDVRLRGAAANPNVTAAPYGYGNVAIEQEHHTPPPSAAFQQQQQQLWLGGGSHLDSESGLTPASFHDEPPTSNSSAAYHRLSTPPRHPKTVSLLRNSRASLAALRKVTIPGNEYHPTPASLENFTLDNGSPSPLHQLGAGRRKNSFNGAFLADGGSGELNGAGSSAPPFMSVEEGAQDDEEHARGAVTTAGSTKKSEAMTIRQGVTASHVPTDGMPMFSSSPPFQANPCELLSTSPGYSYSKNYLRSGSSNVPTFITTDQFQLGLHGAAGGVQRSSFSSSTGLISVKARGFSPDFSDSGVAVWGISPDTPDAFGLALVEPASGSAGSDPRAGGRPRFLSLSEAAEETDDLLDADGSDLMLPFAIGDGSTIGSTATTATESGSTGGASAPSWESASVGNFLHQLKMAPRLRKSAASALGHAEAIGEPQEPAPASQFDDELAGFRSLRDELANVL